MNEDKIAKTKDLLSKTDVPFSNIKIYLHLPEYEGMEFLMVCGAITTWERFCTFTDSFCHLMDNGDIVRYGTTIGTIDDIEVIPVIDVEWKEKDDQPE